MTLSSTGTAPVTISSISVAGSLFSATGVTTPLTLNPGKTAKLTARFTPQAANPWNYTGTITISSNSSTNPSAVINMSGAGVASSTLSSLSCGTSAYTGAGTDACTVSLTGAAPSGFTVALSSNNSAVTVPASISVASGATSASFSAAVSSVTSAQSATLTASSGAATLGFAIQLNASIPALSVSTTTIAFGNVNVGQTATQAVTLSSTGTAPVTISAISVAGSLFGATGLITPLTLNPGQTARLTASFTPQVANPWSYTGTITISSNSSTNPSAVVSMSGAGTAGTALSSLTCGTASYTGAGTDTCTITLSSAAPSGGFAVALSSNNSAVTVPASVTVASGATNASFSAAVSSVTSAQSVTLTASSGAATQGFAIQLNAYSSTLGISPSSVAFSSVAVNSTSAQPVTLTSTGTGSVTVTGATVTGTGFTLTGATFPITLAPGQTSTLNLMFAPTSAGPLTGQLAITSNASTGKATASLSGTGMPMLTALSCGTTSYTGAGTDACTVTLNAAAPAGGTVVSLSSNQAAITVPSSVTVAAGATSAGFTATVTSVSTAEAVTLSAILGSASKTSAIQLNPATSALSVSTSTITFGNVNINQTATQSVTLSSTGTAPVTISSISVAGALFGASGVTTPITLNPGQTARLTASFTPLEANPWSYTGAITISSNSSTNPSAVVNLSGAGVASSTLSSLSCGTSAYTAAGTDACTVTLTGAAPSGGFTVALSSNNSAVTVPASVTVASGATSAAFSGSVSAVTTSQSATITATAGGLSQTFAIQLGTGVGSLSVNATSVPFGGIVENSTAAQSITLTASGTSAVTVSAASISGTGFSVSGMSFPTTLNPGQSATLTIQFAPLTTGSYTGQLTISSNRTGGNIVVSASGTGNPHEVQLSWNPPSSSTDPVAGYNIYRAAGGSTNYVLINTVGNSQTTYSDTAVVHATSYVYYATSVDSSGVESVASNTTTATIP